MKLQEIKLFSLVALHNECAFRWEQSGQYSSSALKKSIHMTVIDWNLRPDEFNVRKRKKNMMIVEKVQYEK